LCTLKSLMKYCSNHIDKIYYIMEKTQLFGSEMEWVADHFDNIIPYTTTGEIINHCEDFNVPEQRYNVRYQYGIENSNKKYVFITHNDVVYTGDIIGDMLNNIADKAGIGWIGQCWNCPAHTAMVCNREIYESYNPKYDEVVSLIKDVESPRTTIGHLFKDKPAPLPECRVNEFSCLIDREICMKECKPNGDTPLFGDGSYLDTASGWFHSLYRKGYRFVNYDIYLTSQHGLLAHGAGHPNESNKEQHDMAEENAKQHFEIYYKE